MAGFPTPTCLCAGLPCPNVVAGAAPPPPTSRSSAPSCFCPRATTRSTSSGSGRCSLLASVQGAHPGLALLAGVRITGIVFGCTAPTSPLPETRGVTP